MQLVRLTTMILNLNAALDSGKYDDISLAEVKTHIERDDIVPWLRERVPDVDISWWSEEDIREYGEVLLSIHGGHAGDERKKWGVQNKGLCLLLAWTNELVQQRNWTDAR